MNQALHKRTVADIPILSFDQVTSTHDIARNAIESRDDDFFDTTNSEPQRLYGVIVAENQTVGRGRRQRTWESAQGSSMLATFIVGQRKENLMIDVAHLMIVMCDVLNRGGANARIKWPNDLVIENGTAQKVGGCLTEVVDPFLLVGIGINLTPDAYSSDLKDHATSLKETGFIVTASELVDDVVTLYTQRVARGVSDMEIWDEYKSACSTLEQHVRVEGITETFLGHARDVSRDGSLVVVKESGESVLVSEGDVIHVRPNG